MGAGASSKTAFEAHAERYASKAKAEAKDAEAHAAAMATTVKGLALAEKQGAPADGRSGDDENILYRSWLGAPVSC